MEPTVSAFLFQLPWRATKAALLYVAGKLLLLWCEVKEQQFAPSRYS
jgi:hypothetical protein